MKGISSWKQKDLDKEANIVERTLFLCSGNYCIAHISGPFLKYASNANNCLPVVIDELCMHRQKVYSLSNVYSSQKISRHHLDLQNFKTSKSPFYD